MSRAAQNKAIVHGIEIYKAATENGIPELLKSDPEMARLRQALSGLAASLNRFNLVQRRADGWHGYAARVPGLWDDVAGQLAGEASAAFAEARRDANIERLMASGKMAFLATVQRAEGDMKAIPPAPAKAQAQGQTQAQTMSPVTPRAEPAAFAPKSGPRISYAPGNNVAASDADIIVNTVNCRLSPSGRGVMGAGVAKAFAELHPYILPDYEAAIRSGELRPGRCLLFPLRDGRQWAALATKDHWQDPSREDWVRIGLAELGAKAKASGARSIAIPPPGCGNGKLEWDEIEPIVVRYLGDFDLHIHAQPSRSQEAARMVREINGTVGAAPQAAAKPAMEATMYFKYGADRRPGVAAASTFEAILRGERTSTTRFDVWAGSDRWGSLPPGSTVRFFEDKDKNGRWVDVVVDSVQRVDLSRFTDAQMDEWSRVEGWSAQHGRAIGSRGPGFQVRYHVGEGEHARLGLTLPRAVAARDEGTVYYAGVGSRETPEDVLAKMVRVGELLAREGWTLRSGGAVGADSAFETGSDNAGGSKQIFIAEDWMSAKRAQANVKGARSDIIGYDARDEEIATRALSALEKDISEYSRVGKALQCRNVRQVLGEDKVTHSDVVIAYTKGGALKGGTATALMIARQNGRPVLNLGDPRWRDASPEQIVAEAKRLVEQARGMNAGQAAQRPAAAGAPAEAPASRDVLQFQGADRIGSNMFAAPVEWGDDVTPKRLFDCNEVPYMLAKTKDAAKRGELMRLYDATYARSKAGGVSHEKAVEAGAKALKTAARGLEHGLFGRPDWESAKLSVMTELVTDKVRRNAHVAAWLLGTGKGHIQEGNMWGDTFWGVALADNPRRGVQAGDGLNHLGRIWMAVREQLAHERHGVGIQETDTRGPARRRVAAER